MDWDPQVERARALRARGLTVAEVMEDLEAEAPGFLATNLAVMYVVWKAFGTSVHDGYHVLEWREGAITAEELEERFVIAGRV